MDILKLLSRSTKQKGNNHSSRISEPNLPSAGTSTNPQLFHDVVPELRGKKRKRGLGKVETSGQDQGDGNEETPNFFAAKASSVGIKSVETPATNADQTNPPTKDPRDSAPVKVLEEGECRQILRSHRLKVTLLPQSNSGPRAKRTKDGKVSKKKVKTKPQFKQLYPQPLAAFGDLRKRYGLSGRMAENLVNNGYVIPTEVQMGSLPLLLQPDVALGEDSKELGIPNTTTAINLLSVAPTGSGKTLAFLIPIINRVIERRRSHEKGNHYLDAVVVAPTKELANQIVNEAKKLSLGTGVKIVGMRKGLNVVGSQPPADQSSSGDDDESDEEVKGSDIPLSQPVAKADILVATPGLLASAISSKTGESSSLPTVRTLVLDEADVLLDPLFQDQVLGIWNACINPELRVTLWSATMGSNIESLASTTIQSRREKLELDDDVPTIRLVVGLKDSAIPNIKHTLTYAATEPGKLLALRQLVHPTAKSSDGEHSLRPPFLIFTQTIPRAIALHSELFYDIPAEAGGSSRIAVLHSDLSDSARDNVMTRFRKGEIWILITTDILSRGVDFRGINGVVNYDVPNSGAAYIHRVGRTGRAGRSGGVAITFYTKEDVPYVKNIANIIAASEKQAGVPPSEVSMQKWFLDALPNPTKNEKKSLKLHGVKARQGGQWKDNVVGKSGTSNAKMQISTKSGYERKMEHNRRGAIEGSRRRAQAESREDVDETKEDEWQGLDS
ncbi:P-loop containing nucleoside triphosphate hydrolase [Glarea lozoyensis ATCC 20868]|uniref:ATP-dependent RNA helicase n=1 Tax=Glarea lozoyensis (strain ATCC 20868 / MF5171) TaxID=1116229 RepID=S3DCL5_GLAL2|nr:P-loop containing nucleoside triphosphate hydrolase [Glarea lozoyensis ATCC 20868]EPE35475.1 P-loop containing nucleoside triphosphate hydrolase [Glarea lozoyensis ATCC 20868]